ncbi:MAG: urea transporter [Holophaga sp.]|nr:urea transporter [Holophaga sp.]
MNQPTTNPWRSATERSWVLEYIDVTLRGSGQVIFMDNPLTGLLNFIAIFWGAIAAGMPQVGIGAVVGTFLATATAYAVGVDRNNLKMGLYGFNGVLVGAGLPTFLAANATMWVFLVIGSIASTILMLAMANVLAKWNCPAGTFPFCVTTWFIMLAAYAFPHLVITGLPHAALAHVASTVPAVFGPFEFIRASLTSVSQVWFINNPTAAIIFLFALVIESRWCAALAFLGGAVAVACAILFGADSGAIANGLWGFSAVLTAPAIGCIFMKPTPKGMLYCLLAVVFTVIIQAALNVACGAHGIPTFTTPFNWAMYIFVLANRNFEKKAKAL